MFKFSEFVFSYISQRSFEDFARNFDVFVSTTYIVPIIFHLVFWFHMFSLKLTSLPVLPPAHTPNEEPTAHSETSTYQPPIIMETAVNVETTTPSSTPASSSTTNQIAKTRGQEVDTNVSTTTSTRLPASTTSIPLDPQNDERGDGENDSRNLVPILVPILLFLVLLIVLCAIFLYRKRQR